MGESLCRNCGNEVIGEYCHNCGQKSDVHKLAWGSLFGELQKRWFGFDNNFARTVKDLTVRPKRVIDATIKGIRVRYIGPVGYYFLMITLYVLAISFLNVDMVEMTKEMVSTVSIAEPPQQEVAHLDAEELKALQAEMAKKEALQSEINKMIFGNLRLFSFLMIPFFITATWLIFKNKKYNFLENSVVNFYGQGHPMILSILALFGYKFFGMVQAQLYITPFSYVYFALVCADFYHGNKIWNFIKGLLAVILGFVLFFIAALIVGFIAGIIMALLNPDALKGLT